MFRDHEFKDPKSNFDAAFRTWLRRAPAFAPRQTNGKPPGLVVHQQYGVPFNDDKARALVASVRRKQES